MNMGALPVFLQKNQICLKPLFLANGVSANRTFGMIACPSSGGHGGPPYE